MNNNNFKQLISPVPSYYVIDGRVKTYEKKEQIKSWAGYWNKEMRCWQIDNPDEKCREELKKEGLIFQFAKYI